MTRERWVAIAVGIAAVVIAYILLSLAHDAQGETPAPLPQCTSDDEAKLKRMMARAFDQAFQQQIAQLYKVYVGNIPTVAEQQKFTKTGITNAIAAWRIGISAADAWEGCK